jgi:hypothetical protein
VHLKALCVKFHLLAPLLEQAPSIARGSARPAAFPDAASADDSGTRRSYRSRRHPALNISKRPLDHDVLPELRFSDRLGGGLVVRFDGPDDFTDAEREARTTDVPRRDLRRGQFGGGDSFHADFTFSLDACACV